MVHVKYTYKDGKRYGPYYYKTERVNGKIITTYLGQSVDDNRKRTRSFVLIGALILLVALGAFLIIGYQRSLTGNVALDIDGTYLPGDVLDGTFTLVFQEGELLPATSSVTARLGGVEKTFSLHSLLSSSSVESLEGAFYADGFSLTGSGTGYGLAGTRVTYPSVQFELEIVRVDDSSDDSESALEEQESSEDSASGESRQLPEDSDSTGDTFEGATKDSSQDHEEKIEEKESDKEEKASEKEEKREDKESDKQEQGEEASTEESTSDESGSESSDSGSTITGGVITGFAVETTISGSASREEPFDYEIEKGYEARLVPGSVHSSEGEVLSDEVVFVEQEGNTVRVRSSYEVELSGFGEDYAGDQIYRVRIPLTLFEMVVENETDLSLSIRAEEQEIVFVEETLVLASEATVPVEPAKLEPVAPSIEEISNETLNETVLVVTPLRMLQEIPSVYLDDNLSAIVNLSEYFEGASSYDLSVSDIIFSFEGDQMILRAEPSLRGIRIGRVIVEAPEGQRLESNDFAIIASETAFSLTTTRTKIVLGEPVRWTINVSVPDGSPVVLQIPAEAQNISVVSFVEDIPEVSEPVMDVSLTGQAIGRIDTRISFWGWLTGLVAGEIDSESALLGEEVLSGEEVLDESSVEPAFDEGPLLYEGEAMAEVDSTFGELLLDEAATEYSVEYYTDPPAAVEFSHPRGKTVILEAPESLDYQDVVVVTNLSNDLRITRPERIQVYWSTPDTSLGYGDLKLQDEVAEEVVVHQTESQESVTDEEIIGESQENTTLSEENLESTLLTGQVIEEGEGSGEEIVDVLERSTIEDGWYDVVPSFEEGALQLVQGRAQIPFEASDQDGDGFIDSIAWVVPHFSNQTYEIIVITQADHLNETRTFISDIYDSVRELDGNWSEPIPDQHYVRVTFERNLTHVNDITIYPRVLEGSPQVEVYEKDSNVTLALFDSISNESYYSIYLTNLSENVSQDMFDLRVMGGSLSFDHIIDPTLVINGNTSDLSIAPLTNESFVLVYVNATNGAVTFKVHNTTGNTIVGPVIVDASSAPNHSRVSVSPINSSAFVIAYLNITSARDYRRAYYSTGVAVSTLQSGDGAIGTPAVHDVATASLENNRVAYCYIDQPEGDADLRTYNITGSSLTTITGESDINAAASPEVTGSMANILDCDYINSTRGVYIEYDAGTDDDITYHMFNENSTEVVTDTDFDTAAGAAGQVAVTSLDNNRFTAYWWNTSHVRMAIRDVNNAQVLAATTLFYNPASTPNRMAVATVRNLTSGRDNSVLVFYNATSVDLIGVGYNGSGTRILDPFVIENAPSSNMPFAVAGEEDASNITLCPGTWVVAYVNSSGSFLSKSYWLNGTEWDGICNRDLTSPNLTFVSPTPSPYANLSGSSIAFNVTSNDSQTDHYTFVDINGDVAFWHTFDFVNVSSGGRNATDRSVWGRNASFVSTSAQQNSTNVRWGSSLGLNGSSGAYLTLPPGTYANITDANFSLSFWMWAADLTAGQGIFASANCLSPYWAVGMHAATPAQLRFVVTNDTSSATGTISSGLTAQQWYHVVIVGWDNYTTTNATLYLNGYSNGSTQLTALGGKYNLTAPNIGRYQCWGTFNGTLDDMILFRRVLTPNEVLSLYNATARQYDVNLTGLPSGQYNATAYATDTGGSYNATAVRTVNLVSDSADTTNPQISFVSPTPANASTHNGNSIYVNVTSNDSGAAHYVLTDFNRDLLAWLRMDNVNSSGDPLDSSTWYSNGSAKQEAVQNVDGYYGAGFTLDGVDDYISLPTSIEHLSLANANFTVSFWIRSYNFSTKNMVGKIDSSGNNGWNFRLVVPDDVVFITGNGTDNNALTADTVIEVDRWYHVVGTYNGTTKVVYLNGTLVNTDVEFNAVHNASEITPLIGRHPAVATQYFNGSIDEVLIFNRSLTASEVLALYNASATQYENNFTNLASGQYNITSYAVDASGNLNQTEMRRVTLGGDTSAPNIMIHSPVYGRTYNLNDLPLLINVSLDEPGDTVQYTLTNGILNYTMSNTGGLFYNATNTSIASSTYTLFVYANDSAGNLNRTSTLVSFTVLTDIVSGCANLSQPHTLYTLNQSITTSTSSCINITAHNVTLNGANFNITYSGSANSLGINASGRDRFDLWNITLSRFTTSVGIDSQSSGIRAGNVTIYNSTIGSVTAQGYDNNTGGGVDSAGSNGGYVIFRNSTILPYSNISVRGGNATGAFGNPGYPGTVEVHGVFLNLSYSHFNLSNGRGEVIPTSYPGVLVINFSSGFESIRTTLGGYTIERFALSNSTAGQIVWYTHAIDEFPVYVSVPTNLSNFVSIGPNSAFVDPSVGLNQLANISLYNVPTTFAQPAILRNDELCSSTICSNSTTLTAGTVRFNVTGWSNYSIGHWDVINPQISFVSPTLANASTHNGNSIYVNVTSNDSSALHYTFTDFDRNLVLWMRMDDINTTKAPVDLGSWSYNATVEGEAHRNLSGRFGYGFLFDGPSVGSADRLVVDNLSGNSSVFNGSFTVSAWIKTASTGEISDILGVEGAVSSNPGFTLRLPANGRPRFIVGNGSDIAQADGTYTFNNNTWYHLVGVHNASGLTYLYVNGTLIDSGTSPVPCCSNPERFTIGKTDNNGRIFNGTIDEVLIFNRSLTASEVLALYNASATQYENNFTNLTAGQHVFTAHTVDANGNRNSTSRTITLTSTTVTSCTTLDQPNTVYTLGASFAPTGYGPCINITAENVTFTSGGPNYYITNDSYNYTVIETKQNGTIIYGIRINVSASYSTSRAIVFNATVGSKVIDVFVDSSYQGIYIEDTSDSIINYSTFANSTYGIFILSTVTRFNITDSIFNNASNSVYSVGTGGGISGLFLNNLTSTSSSSTALRFTSTSRPVVSNFTIIDATTAINLDSLSTGANLTGVTIHDSRAGILIAPNTINLNDVVINGSTLYGIRLTGGSAGGNYRNLTFIQNNVSLSFLPNTGQARNNNFTLVHISNSTDSAITFDASGVGSVGSNNFTNLTIVGTNVSYYDVEFVASDSDLQDIKFEDSYAANYSFTGTGGRRFIFASSRFGDIKFLSTINGSGTNLTGSIRVTNSTAFVDPSNYGINRSANVTFLGMPMNFTNPVILRDGTQCTTCYNFTSLNAATVIFNVTSWSNYSISSNLNSAPLASTVFVNSTLGSNKTDQDLNCYTTLSDTDANTFLNVTTYWYNNSVLVASVDRNVSYANGTAFSSSLLHANTTKAQNWSCGLRIFDGSLYTYVNATYNITILNSLPNVTLIAPAHAISTTDRSPIVNFTVMDADAESITWHLNVTLNQFSTCTDIARHYFSSQTVTAEGSNLSYEITPDLNCLYDNLDYYNWSVRAIDNEGFGEWSTVRYLNISSIVSITLLNGTIEFGSLGYLSTNDTSDDSPRPFLLENDGNAFVNVTIESTPLWLSQGVLGTDNYQFKVANYTLENSSFWWFYSQTTYEMIPITEGATQALASFNYTNATDSAEIDINVTVPANEVPGIRRANVTFTASLAE